MEEIELKTAPADARFPTTNQSRHCFTRYIEFHRCLAANGDGSAECDKFAKYYRSLCPGEWFSDPDCPKKIVGSPLFAPVTMNDFYMVDRWNEQRENGIFPGPL